MESRRSAADVWTVFTPAKLNLYFEVLAKRPDGFHEIETLMAPIRLFDALRFRRRDDGQIHLNCRWAPCVERDARFWRGGARNQPPPAAPGAGTGHGAHDPLATGALVPELPEARENLVVRALEMMREEAHRAASDAAACKTILAAGADVELVKRIPLAAGLAGGSSDAAAALLVANIAWRLDWPLERLAALAGRLGSDVPFFLQAGELGDGRAGGDGRQAWSGPTLRDRAAAVCRGRGERIEPVGQLPSLWLVVVKPASGLATAEVYRHCRAGADGQATAGRAERLALALAAGNRRAARRLMGNRLEQAAERLSDWPDRLRGAFARGDCELKQMSGSGTSYFGLGRHARHARRVARRLAAQRLGSVFVVQS